MSDCCRDFSRSQILRAAAARAGNGLPAIEPGMPTPAGTGLSRRSFVLRSAGLAMSVYGASRLGLGALEEGVARAATAPGQRVLVSVFMPGGVDSLSLLAPVGDAKYAEYRPTLALDGASTTPFAEDSSLHWHPSAAPLAKLHGEGKVTVIPAIGYDHPDQSHFTSRHYWEVGALDAGAGYGWMGRYLDRHGDPANPLQGLSLDSNLSPTLAAATVPVSAVPDPADYSFWVPGVGNPIEQPMLRAFGALGQLPAPDAAFRQARGVASRVDRLRTQLEPLGKDGKPTYTTPVAYPSGTFGKRLAALAAMVAGNLPLRCVAITAPGSYDTHSNQVDSLTKGLKQTFDGLLAFQRDLEARGIADRVLVKVWSEFGRRPSENGSGTDHGAAGSAFLIGSRVRGQMIGQFPGLATLDPQQNLRSTADFRALYCGLLEQWLDTDAAEVIPDASKFARPALVA
ncbi:MAG: hypothetical protein QOH76_80 [Thermoleophilaceae bacterium]|jgi:uncharacterized protein (DUF1501 family)|nr:hypothetical protein [Thermoleophilaceae bacterium]